MNRMWWMTVVLGVSLFGCGAISIVWLRMEISATAGNCAKLEDQREMVARELHELRGRKSRLMRPSALAGMVSGRLSIPNANRTIYVTKNEFELSRQKRHDFADSSVREELASNR